MALALPASGTAATNLVQRPGTAGCVTEASGSGLCQEGHGLVGPASIALSPDGLEAYVAASHWDSVATLARSPEGGGLAPIDDPHACFDSLEALYPACTPARELGGADDVAVSPDGKSVYVTALSDNAVLVFHRDPLTGELSLSSGNDGCINRNGSNTCASARGLQGPRAVLISPDDQNVYVASSGSNGGIAVFDRNPTTGDLVQKSGTAGCLNPSGAEGCAAADPQLLDARAIAISPDGKNVYAASRVDDAVTIYDRAPNGELTPKAGSAGCIDEAGGSGCQDGTAIIEPAGITVSPDEENVYVAGSRSDSIAVFDRNTTTGALTQKPGTAGCVSNTGASDPMQAGTAGACQDGAAMDGVNSIAVLPNGTALYATAGESSSVVVFERHTGGMLTQRPGTAGCITDSGYEDTGLPWTAGVCQNGSALLRADHVIASPDSRFVYATAEEGGVGIFDVVAPAPPPAAAAPASTAASPSGPSASCLRTQDTVRRAERRVDVTTRVIHREARKALRARRPSVQRKHARALTEARHTIWRWRRVARHARRRARSLCAGA